MTVEVNLFLRSWRGFLVGTKRAWHSHQRPRLQGFRSGSVLAASGVQLHQLRRLTFLVGDVFARGGQLWGFGLGTTSQKFPWGIIHSEWRPGTLSNHFRVRLQKVQLARKLRRVFRPGRARRTRRGLRLSRRWSRLLREGGLPAGVLRNPSKKFTLSVYSARLVSLAGSGVFHHGKDPLQRQPREGNARTRWSRGWWRSVPRLASLGGTPRAGRPTPRAGPFFARLGLQLRRRRSTRAVPPGRTTRVSGFTLFGGDPAHPGRPGHPPRGFRRRRHRRWTPRGGSRFQRDRIPALVVGSGWTPWGVTLVREATAGGFLLCSLEGSNTNPSGTGVYPVLWNQDPRSTAGVIHLVDYLWGRSFRISLLRVLWGRLSLSGRVDRLTGVNERGF